MKRPSCLTSGAACFFSLLLIATSLRAELRWESRLVQQDAPLGAEDVNLTFTFSNPSTKSITITQVETSCGCTAASLAKKTYAAGEKGTLEVTFDARGASGLQQKTLQVSTDDGSDPTTLTIRVTVPMWLEISPRLLWWKIGEKGTAREAIVTLNENGKIRLTSVSTDNAALQASLQSDTSGHYRLILQPLSTKESMQATVTLVAEAPGTAPRKYAVFAQVR